MEDDNVPVSDFRDIGFFAQPTPVAALINGRLVNGRIKHGAFVTSNKEARDEMSQPVDGCGIEDRQGVYGK